MLSQNKKFVFGILTALFFLNFFAWLAVFNLKPPPYLEINFFNVGQGDAIFIETPQKHQILIDAGPDSKILEKLAEKMPSWDRTIDLIILTHPETDHMTGFIEVLKKYKVENILWTGLLRNTAEFKEWQRLINEEKEKEGAQIKIARQGLKIVFPGKDSDEKYGYCIEILYPWENLEDEFIKDANSSSVVTRLIFKDTSFLFTGDIYKSDERKILEAGNNIDSDVLKVSHHGSKSSTDEEFIEKVSPEIAVISAGKNNQYGHPHQEVLETLNKYGIDILRTDLLGDIEIISDGKNLKIISNGKQYENSSI